MKLALVALGRRDEVGSMKTKGAKQMINYDDDNRVFFINYDHNLLHNTRYSLVETLLHNCVTIRSLY